MALIKCPECGKEVSDKAKECIHCGYPLAQMLEDENDQPQDDPITEYVDNLPEAYEGDAPFIFISYSHLDSKVVYELIETLQKRGYRVWYDGGIHFGDNWIEFIVNQIESSGCFVAFISKNYFESRNCNREILYAANHIETTLLIYLEQVDLPKKLDYLMGEVQALSYFSFKDKEKFFANMCNATGIGRCLDEGKEIPAGQAVKTEKSAAADHSQDKERKEYMELLIQSAEEDDPIALTRLGICYARGQGVSRDYQKAAACFRKAADRGYEEAQINLGVSYTTGNGVSRDYEKAIEWFTKAAMQGNTDAQARLGLCYAFGQGVEQDYQKAVEWFTTAAKMGDAKAQVNLGVCFRDGLGVDRDPKKAFDCFQKAAEQGHAEAQNNLAQCYLQGQGVDRDPAKAVKWFLKSADQGNVYAQINLGGCYLQGEGVSQDPGKAAEWFKKAADQGDPNACFNLGLCYENGWGVKRDYKMAKKYYGLAAQEGDANAFRKITALKEKGLI